MFFVSFKELVLLLLMQQINSATWLEILSLGLLRSQQATLVSKNSRGLLQFLAKLQYCSWLPPIIVIITIIIMQQ